MTFSLNAFFYLTTNDYDGNNTYLYLCILFYIIIFKFANKSIKRRLTTSKRIEVCLCSQTINNEFVLGRIAFEKLTDVDFSGTAYYTVRNLSLYECHGWCREEPDCQAASFR